MNSSPYRYVPGMAAVLAAGLLAGCSSSPEEHVVSAPPPAAVVTSPATQQVVVSQPATTATVVTSATPMANGTLLITQAPPLATQPTVVAVRPERPTPAHVWVEGYWAWRNDHYLWADAHWEVPPYSNASWVPPRWEQRSDGNYIFYEGYWK